MKKSRAILLFLLSGIPLMAYPAIFVANIMSIAAYGSDEGALATQVFSICFLISSLVYPVVFILAIVLFWKTGQARYVYWPFFYLGLIAIFLLGWLLSS